MTAYWPASRAISAIILSGGTLALHGSTELTPTDNHVPVAGTVAPRTSAISSRDSYSPRRAGFALRTGSVISSYDIQTVSVNPGNSLLVSVANADDLAQFDLHVDAGLASRSTTHSWQWRAPEEPGLYQLRVIRRYVPDTIAVNAFVTVPRTLLKEEHLNDYRIGRYPRPPRPIYRHPEGFIEVTPQNIDVWVSPHFRLRQFVCKQQSGYPKYVVLDPTILNKLEMILERLNAAGYRASSFNVMSGYRTPYYNHAIGNVPLSRHVWGAAADIFIDEDGDGYMDDINGDGRQNIADITILYEIANGLADEANYQVYLGGLGTYRKNSRHGPFLHVDVRGRKARWSR